MAIGNMYGDPSKFEECRYFWTSYTDKYGEGRFVYENSNETINESQWHHGQPDGGIHVGFSPQDKTFFDLPSGREICVSCGITSLTEFTMRGTCRNSFLETAYFPTFCRGYIGFIANLMLIW